MARWQRASRLLSLPAGARVLDLGCAFGFGTRILAQRYRVHGHDLDLRYVERARRSVPSATFSAGRADHIPCADGAFDAVVLLDVLEHVPDDRSVIAEVARVLVPGGQLVLTTPNLGLLAGWDSLNVYQHFRLNAWPAPTDDPSWPASPMHRHYDVAKLLALLGDQFEIKTAGYTGLGVAEPVNLLLLWLFRGLIDAPRVYRALQYLYFGIYVLEDAIPAGAWGYHITITARRCGELRH